MNKRVPNIVDLSWVDEFIKNIKPYVYVREEDNLLIKRPNAAQKLNSTGTLILKTLLGGKTIHQLLDEIGRDGDKIKDIANFMYAVKHQLEGLLEEFTSNPAVEVVPFEMPFSKYPVLSEIAVTYKCNLKCLFCYAGCGCTKNPAKNGQEMTKQQIKHILKKIMDQAKVPSVSFTGGEPTLLHELPELVAYAKKLGMRVNLITNGTLITRELAGILSDKGLDSAQVSIEGITAATHDSIVGMKGAFEKSVDAVSYLKETGVLTHTNTTITKANLEECVKIPGFAKDTLGNDRFSMNLVIPTGSVSVNEALIMPYTDIGEILERIIEESRRQKIEFMWYSPVPMCMFNSIVHGLGNKGCSACDGLISISPNGDVLPCASYDESVGNLLNDEFETIWNSRKAKDFRQKRFAHPKCRECENFYICNGACPLYWRQVGFDELILTRQSCAG